MSTPSRERTLGRAILGDELLLEALEAFAQDESRTVPNGVEFLLHRVLADWGWLGYVPDTGYVPGPHLEAHRRLTDPEYAALGPLAPVVALRRPARAGARS